MPYISAHISFRSIILFLDWLGHPGSKSAYSVIQLRTNASGGATYFTRYYNQAELSALVLSRIILIVDQVSSVILLTEKTYAVLPIVYISFFLQITYALITI